MAHSSNAVKRVLFVDDTTDTLGQIKVGHDVIKPSFEAVFADNASNALMRYRQARSELAPFDLIVSDIAMSDDTGLSVAKLIRAGGDNETKFIFFTGFEGALNRQEAEDVNASRFLVKPLTPVELFAEVLEVLHEEKSSAEPRRRAGDL